MQACAKFLLELTPEIMTERAALLLLLRMEVSIVEGGCERLFL